METTPAPAAIYMDPANPRRIATEVAGPPLTPRGATVGGLIVAPSMIEEAR